MLTLGCRSTFPDIRLCKSTNLNAHDQKISRLLSSFNKSDAISNFAYLLPSFYHSSTLRPAIKNAPTPNEWVPERNMCLSYNLLIDYSRNL